MKIYCVQTGPIMTNCYVVTDDNNSAFIVDVAFEGANDIMNTVKKYELNVEFILLTHSHWDHCGDAHKIKELTNAPIYIHKQDEYRMLNPNEHTVFPLPYRLNPTKADKYLDDKEIIQFNNNELEIIHTPGHTEGSITIIDKTEKNIFSGDVIFKESIGRTDLPGGNFDEIISSIAKLMEYEDDFSIFSGHGEETTIGHERSYNPFIINYLSK